MLGDLRPPPAPRITCNCGKTWAERMVDGTGSGNCAGKIPPTVGIDPFGTLADEARRGTRSSFSQLPALTSAATGAAQSSLEARGSLSGRKAVLLKEQLLLPDLCVSGYSRRAVHDSVGRNASAPRNGAERYLCIPEPTCVRRIRFAQPRHPLP